MTFKKGLIFGVIALITLAFTFKVLPLGKDSKSDKNVGSEATSAGDTITTPSGLRYVITKPNPSGTQVKAGSKVEAHYTGTLTNGKKFDSSRDRNQTFSFVVGAGQVIAGWDEGFSYLKTGEQATLIIPPGLGYGQMDMGAIPANSTLIFDVEVVGVTEPMAYSPYSGEGKDTISLPSGLRYIIIDKGDVNIKAQPTQTAQVYYAGYLLNGFKFDGNFDRFDPLELKVVDGRVIKGWQEMLPQMNKGMKVRAIIPPSLGYGSRNMGDIPPNSTLIFDMFLYDLK